MEEYQINDLLDRSKKIEKTITDDIVFFAELYIKPEYVKDIRSLLIEVGTESETYCYIKNKLHGNLVLKESRSTCREEWSDIQYIFTLGLYAQRNSI